MKKGWKEVTIGDLGKVVTGNTPPRKIPEYFGNHTLFIKPTDINVGEKYCYEPEECYSKIAYAKYKKSLIPKDSICVVTIGSIGQKMIKSHKELFINQAMNAIVPNAEYDPDFVYYLLKANLFQLKTFDSGTASGRENVSKSSFSNIKVTVPKSKDVQVKIGYILSAYDDLIENNLKRIKLLEEKAHLTYEEWFVRMKFPGHESTPINEETGLPEGWRKGKISELTKFVSGFPFKSSTYSEAGPFGIVTIKNIQDGKFNPKTTDKIIELPNKLKDEQRLFDGDILLSLTGNIGRTCLVFGKNLLLNQRVAKLSPLQSEFRAFIYTYFRNPSTQINLANISNGAAQQNLSPVKAGELGLPIPDHYSMNSFNLKVEPIIDLIVTMYNQNQLLKEARDILLPRLMTGMIEVDGLDLSAFEQRDQEEMLMAAEANQDYKLKNF